MLGPELCWGEKVCCPTEFKEFAVEVATILSYLEEVRSG